MLPISTSAAPVDHVSFYNLWVVDPPVPSSAAHKDRIAYIITRAHRGGAQAHVAALMKNFQNHYDLYLATGEEGYLTDIARECGAKVTILNNMRPELSPLALVDDIRTFAEIWRWLGAVQPALLHAHSSKAGGLGRYAALLRRVPTVFTAHGWGFTGGVPWSQKLVMLPAEWAVARVSSAIITVSQADLELARKYRIRARGPVVAIHNGISDDAPPRAATKANTVEIACVARFSSQKDQALLVRALATVDRNWHLTFAGEGPSEDDVRRLVNELGLDHRVEFLGATGNVDKLLARSQIFVLPSNWEGFPITILEAMRAGLPVVASNVGGVQESVVDGVTGYLIERGNVDAMASKLGRLIKDPELRTRMGRKGREAYLRDFVDTKMFEQVHSLYGDIAKT